MRGTIRTPCRPDLIWSEGSQALCGRGGRGGPTAAEAAEAWAPQLWAGLLWISFTAPVDAARAALLENYLIQSATRVSTTSYGGADRERRTDRITSVEVANDRMSVVLKVEALRVGFVYDIRLRNLTVDDGVFFPAEAYYTLRTIPAE